MGDHRFVDALGVVRFLRHRVDDTTAWDIGGRVVWEASDSVSLSGEAVQRMWSAGSLTENSLRAVGSFEVKLADKAYLFATFGRDFTEVGTGTESRVHRRSQTRVRREANAGD